MTRPFRAAPRWRPLRAAWRGCALMLLALLLAPGAWAVTAEQALMTAQQLTEREMRRGGYIK